MTLQKDLHAGLTLVSWTVRAIQSSLLGAEYTCKGDRKNHPKEFTVKYLRV